MSAKTESLVAGRWTHLFYIPSFYGLVLWCIWFGLYTQRWLTWDDSEGKALALFTLATCFFLGSMLLLAPRFHEISRAFDTVPDISSSPKSASRWLLALHCIGFVGIVKYTFDFAARL